jgi:hypothetical protein
MRVARLVLSFLLVLSSSSHLNSQQMATTPPRDPQALTAVQKAVAALGGTTLSQIHDASVQGAIQILPASANQTFSVVWEDAWGKGAPSFRRESHVGGSVSVLVSGNGQPVDSQGGITMKVPRHVAFSCAAVHLPGIILAAQLNNVGYSFKFVEITTLNGQAAVHIQSALTSDPVASALTLQDWYFDPSSGLPLRVDYRVATSPDLLNPGIVSMQFANFQSVSGILVPFRLSETGLAGEQDVVTITSVTLNSGLSPNEFLPATGAAQ